MGECRRMGSSRKEKKHSHAKAKRVNSSMPQSKERMTSLQVWMSINGHCFLSMILADVHEYLRRFQGISILRRQG